MHKRIGTIFLIVFFALTFITAGVLIAADVPDQITIDNQVYKNKKKGPVPFSHKTHSIDDKIACTECHHDYQNGKNVWKEGDPVKNCTDCHDPEKKEGNKDKLQIAFHHNCEDCHKELKKEGKKTGPTTKCNDCHEKK